MDREPPLARMDAVISASPSLPGGSKAEPVIKRIRKVTNGEFPGRRILGRFGGDACDGVRKSNNAKIATGEFEIGRILHLKSEITISSFRSLAISKQHNGAVICREIAAGYGPNIFRRDLLIQDEQLIDC